MPIPPAQATSAIKSAISRTDASLSFAQEQRPSSKATSWFTSCEQPRSLSSEETSHVGSSNHFHQPSSQEKFHQDSRDRQRPSNGNPLPNSSTPCHHRNSRATPQLSREGKTTRMKSGNDRRKHGNRKCGTPARSQHGETLINKRTIYIAWQSQ